MCGICGIVNLNGRYVEKNVVSGMVGILSHRGPDDEGIYLNETAALASRRLSIIDLETGKQPLHNENNSIWVICNGEIYNYRQLSSDLKARRHIFNTKSDSEVIIHLYEEYQEKCVDYLNGIFAFALWDNNAKKLILARDRLGVKPLFYYHDKNKLIFASEIKSILETPDIEKKINLEALYHFLSLNYIPSPLTIFENIHSLPAGCMLVCDNKNIKMSKYWDVVFKRMDYSNEANIYEELKDRINTSVKMQLVSDVPVGAFLSGGIDSSSIVHFMRKNYNGPIKTFNVRFQEPSYDESYYANLASRFFDTQHYEVFCGPKDYLKYIPDVIWHADNLTVDVSMLPVYLVSKLASQQVKVVLTGDGADELFAGYPTYIADKLASSYQKLPYFLKSRFIPSLIERLPTSYKKMSFEFKAKRFIQGALLPEDEAHFSWRVIFSEADKVELLNKDILNHNFKSSFWTYQRFYEDTNSWESLSRHQYADIKAWLADSILAKVDFMSMANSLEARVPYLDHNLVEFVAGIPAKLRLRKFSGKHILKKTMVNQIPSPILKRPKSGFNIPIGKWLRKDLKEFMSDVLSEERTNSIGLFNPGYIRKLIDDHLSLKADNGYKLLSLIHFFLWYNKFMKNVQGNSYQS